MESQSFLEYVWPKEWKCRRCYTIDFSYLFDDKTTVAVPNEYEGSVWTLLRTYLVLVKQFDSQC